MKKKILITGASGFIAKNIVEQLGGKYNFVTTPHSKLDLSDTEAVAAFFRMKGPFDMVIHTANVGGNRKIPNTAEIASTNLRMFFNIARCKRYFGKMIHLGSGIEYGKERPLKKVKENDFDKHVPQDNFGFYKYLCGKFIESNDGFLNLRLFGIFGKYEDYSIRFISNAICKSILGMPITINQNVFFDYLYIDDFVRILDYFINHQAHYKSYNTGTGQRIDLLTIARKINKIADRQSPIMVKHIGLANEYTCNNRRLMKEIDDFKFTDFDKSIEELYRWYEELKPQLSINSFLDDHF